MSKLFITNLRDSPRTFHGRTCNRKSQKNCSRSLKIKCTNDCEALVIVFFENNLENMTVSEFVKYHALPHTFIKNLSEAKTGWNHPSARERTLKMASDNK